MRGVLAVVGLLGVAAAGLAWSVNEGLVYLQHPGLDEFPIQGLDVSHHQGPIDWPRVASHERFRFVWIKATEGGDFRDARFAENWAGARDAGLVVGAYHFFTLCKPGSEQAQNLLGVLPTQRSRTLPLALDLELGGNCSARPSRDAVRAEVDAFLSAVKGATGRPPVIYTTHDFHAAYLEGDYPSHHPLWLRDVFFRPDGLDDTPWTVWQYLSRGHVDGIEGFVDQNAFRGDAEAFEALVAD